MGRLPVTLQINVAPSDHWHLGSSAAHHLRTWGGQVDEVLFAVDTLRSPGPRGAEWEEGGPKIAAVLDDMRSLHPNVRAIDVDYARSTSEQVSAEFFGGGPIPAKDCFGAPFYAYLCGMHAATNQLVLHLDADMLFGGGSQYWLEEAIDATTRRPGVLVSGPLPGPPTLDGRIPPAIAERHRKTQRYGSAPIPQDDLDYAYAFRHMTTRVFLIDRERFSSRVGSLRPMRLLRRTYPRGLGHPPFFPLETVFSRAMYEHDLVRLNMLGTDVGMWFVHPPPRRPGTEAELGGLIERVERGTVPEAQRGDDQVNGSMTGWGSEASDGPAPGLWLKVARRVMSLGSTGSTPP